MAEYTTKDLRNIVFVGHGGCGKTTLCDQILFKAGAATRAGSVDEKNSLFDFDEEERERQNSIFSAVAHCKHNGRELNVVDAPGYMDFTGAAIAALHAADTAVLTISAPNGIELNTRKMWAAAKERGLAVIIAVTKMDGENIVDCGALLGSIQETLGSECMPLNLPIGVSADFKGVVDLLNPLESAPDGVLDDVSAHASAFMEKIVESDEALMERYLNDEKISGEELRDVMSNAIRDGSLVPILHVSGRTGDGVEELMDLIANYAPSPDTRVVKGTDKKSGDEVELKCDESAPLVAQVWKTVTDPFVGKLTFFRVLQGKITSDSQVYNARTEKNERITHILRPFGKENNQVPDGIPGDLLAVAKIEEIGIGDTLCAPGTAVTAPAPTFPTPMVSLAIEPKTRGDEQKISGSMRKLADEDPTLHLGRDQQTGELVVTGMSQLHLGVVLHRLSSRFGVEVDTKPPRIPYKETITVPADGSYRHKKQTGGRGQFGEVWFKMEPMERGEGFEFVDEIVGGAIPNQYIPAVEKGVRETMDKGILAGYPVVDVRVRLHFGKYHDVDSSEAAFKLAASMCFQEVFMKSKPVLLEPIVNLEITVPSQYMGDITGDLNSRRGRIQGMDQAGDMQTIRAQVPMAEVMNYSTELRSMTGGTGGYGMEFSHLDIVPARAAEAIIARAKQEKEESH